MIKWKYSLLLSLWPSIFLCAQAKYEKADRSYNIEVSLEEDTVLFEYEIDFRETDSTSYAYYKTASLDTFLYLLQKDPAFVENKDDILFYIHGMMGGQKMNLRYTKYDLEEKYIAPENSDIARLITIKWPGNNPVYKIDKGNVYKVADDIAKMLIGFIAQVQSWDGKETIQFDVLNHSLGCELFKEVLVSISEPKKYFDQIVFAAPDLDIDVFTPAGPLARIKAYCNRATVYYSNKDLTLGFSRQLNKKERLGLDGPDAETQFSEQLLFINMSHVMDEKMLPMRMSGHSYYRASAIAGEDILHSLLGSELSKVPLRTVSRDNPYIATVITE